ncbi:hypothetical protein WA026_014023 [Henosepilachna vigintioctopunctata]|uniref:Uncharacterized protein n=1 Tax=Henosepilachna vigintioctopunctata TaxID=420089 RepID=A0AAW1U6T6_9CUCU
MSIGNIENNIKPSYLLQKSSSIVTSLIELRTRRKAIWKAINTKLGRRREMKSLPLRVDDTVYINTELYEYMYCEYFSPTRVARDEFKNYFEGIVPRSLN